MTDAPVNVACTSRNFGLRSVGVCEAYPSFDKTFSKFFGSTKLSR